MCARRSNLLPCALSVPVSLSLSLSPRSLARAIAFSRTLSFSRTRALSLARTRARAHTHSRCSQGPVAAVPRGAQKPSRRSARPRTYTAAALQRLVRAYRTTPSKRGAQPTATAGACIQSRPAQPSASARESLLVCCFHLSPSPLFSLPSLPLSLSQVSFDDAFVYAQLFPRVPRDQRR